MAWIGIPMTGLVTAGEGVVGIVVDSLYIVMLLLNRIGCLWMDT